MSLRGGIVFASRSFADLCTRRFEERRAVEEADGGVSEGFEVHPRDSASN